MPTIEELKTQFGNNARLLKRTVGAFLRTWPKEFEELKEALAVNDLERTGRSAHRLKGSLGYFAPRETQAIALKLEEAAEQGNAERVSDLTDKLEDSLKELNGDLNAMLEGLEGGN